MLNHPNKTLVATKQLKRKSEISICGRKALQLYKKNTKSLQQNCYIVQKQNSSSRHKKQLL